MNTKKKNQFELGIAFAEKLHKSEIDKLEQKIKDLLLVKDILQKHFPDHPIWKRPDYNV